MDPGWGVHIQVQGSEMQPKECCLFHSTRSKVGFWNIHHEKQADNSTAQYRPALPQETVDRSSVPVQALFGQTETSLDVCQPVRHVNMRERDDYELYQPHSSTQEAQEALAGKNVQCCWIDATCP